MRQRDKEKPNKTTPENTKHPTQEPAEEIYSLEDILAEYGTRRSTVRTAVPVNSPWTSRRARYWPSPGGLSPRLRRNRRIRTPRRSRRPLLRRNRLNRSRNPLPPSRRRKSRRHPRRRKRKTPEKMIPAWWNSPRRRACCPLCSSVWAARPTGMPTRCFRSRRRWTRRRSAVWRS